jgi:hypothetical protein
MTIGYIYCKVVLDRRITYNVYMNMIVWKRDKIFQISYGLNSVLRFLAFDCAQIPKFITSSAPLPKYWYGIQLQQSKQIEVIVKLIEKMIQNDMFLYK